MQWCKLSSTESKYKIEIKPSKLHYYFVIAESLALFLLANALSFVLLAGEAFYLAALISLLSAFCYFYQARKSTNLLVFVKNLPINFCQAENDKFVFELSDSGLFQVDARNNWQITAKSKLSYWGCCLVLAPADINFENPVDINNDIEQTGEGQQETISQIKKFFLFKDHVNACDYARIVRTVLKCKSNAQHLNGKVS